jgi:predicted subunit of tRNA(5-methylaminomethyl-2-thiouridylate) methyltransferase
MSGTNMQDALVFIKMADGCGIRLILISDGQPDDREGALRMARTFTSRIDVIYIGPPDGEGERFLAELANCTGGVLVKTGAAEIEKSARLLLNSGV